MTSPVHSVVAQDLTRSPGTAPRPVVAVVEDDPATRKALGRLLRAAGFEPVLFESAEAYLDAGPVPLCVIVDVRLPGISGIELQQRLSAADAAPPIIVTTATHEPVIRERAQQHGCAGFFLKPVDCKTLMGLIASIANARPASNEGIAVDGGDC